MKMKHSLVHVICDWISKNSDLYSVSCFFDLPVPVLTVLVPYLSAWDLYRLEEVFTRLSVSTDGAWRQCFKKRFPKLYFSYCNNEHLSYFRSTSTDFHQLYLEEHVNLMMSYSILSSLDRPENPMIEMKKPMSCVNRRWCHDKGALFYSITELAQQAKQLHISGILGGHLYCSQRIMALLRLHVKTLKIHMIPEGRYEEIRPLLEDLIELGNVEHGFFNAIKLDLDNLRDFIGLCAGYVSSCPGEGDCSDIDEDDYDCNLSNEGNCCSNEDIQEGNSCTEKTSPNSEFHESVDKINSGTFDEDLFNEAIIPQTHKTKHTCLRTSTNSLQKGISYAEYKKSKCRNKIEELSSIIVSPSSASNIKTDCRERKDVIEATEESDYANKENKLLSELDSSDLLASELLDEFSYYYINFQIAANIFYPVIDTRKIKEVVRSGKDVVIRKKRGLTSFSLVHLTSDSLQECLEDVLPHWRSLENLSLEMYVGFKEESFMSVILCLIQNHQLKCLSLDNAIHREDFFTHVLETLKQDYRFTDERGPMKYFKFICSSLPLSVIELPNFTGQLRGIQHLDLSTNTFSESGFSCLVSLIRVDRALTKLNLNGCSLKDKEVLELLEVLTVFNYLEELELSSNKFGSEACLAMTPLINKNQSLARLCLNDCNLQASFDVDSTTLLGREGGFPRATGLFFSDNMDMACFEPKNVISESFITAIQSHSALENLQIQKNHLGSTAVDFTIKLFDGTRCPILKSLNIGYNFIQSEDLLRLAVELHGCLWSRYPPMLRHLSLTGNHLGEMQAEIRNRFAVLVQDLDADLMMFDNPYAEFVAMM